jgi:hypothetical protein
MPTDQLRTTLAVGTTPLHVDVAVVKALMAYGYSPIVKVFLVA